MSDDVVVRPAAQTAVPPAPIQQAPTVDPPGPRVLGAVLGAAVVGAVALPGARVGIGWPLTLVAVVVVALVARAERRRSAEPATTADASGSGAPQDVSTVDRIWRIAAAVAAAALVSTAAIRAAEWLVALCLAAGVLVGSYALVGGRSWAAVVRGGLALIPGTVLALGWAASAPRPAGRPDQSVRPNRAARLVAAIAAGLTLLVVFGALFRSADAAFADLTAGWVRDLRPDSPGRIVLGALLVGLAALGTAYLVRRPPRSVGYAPAAQRRLGLAEWVVPVAMLDLLFGVFVWVQFRVLFAGDGYVMAPGGPDYADYARGGSAQLAVAVALTLGVFAILGRWAGRASTVELGLLRLLGGLLCGLTLVVVASALTRLALYAGAYGLTPLRLLAFSAVVWLGLVVVAVLVSGVRLRAPWLPRVTAAAAVAVLLALAAVNPDTLIARTVLARIDGPYPVDFTYLESLSADAVDELVAIPNPYWACRVQLAMRELSTPEHWYAFNVSREHARQVLRQHPVAIRTCR